MSQPKKNPSTGESINKPEKAPAFQFYPRDFLADINVISMSYEERGIYITLLAHDWLENGLTEKQIQGWLKGGSTLVSERFQPHPDRIGYFTNPRLQKERLKQAEWRQKSSEGGKKSADIKQKQRVNRSKGGCEMVATKLQPKVNSSSATTTIDLTYSEDRRLQTEEENRKQKTEEKTGTRLPHKIEPVSHQKFELPPIDESDPYQMKARDALEMPLEQPWTLATLFLNQGRRPMKRYPSISLTEPDLARILKTIEEAGIPREEAGKVFQAATDRLVTMQRQGKSTEFVCVEGWLTGFCLTETIEVLKKGMQLKTTKERSNNGRY